MVPFIRDWRVIVDHTSSDHRTIKTTLSFDKTVAGEDTQQIPRRFLIPRADWDRFNECLVESTEAKIAPLPLASKQDVECFASTMTDSLIEACKASMPTKGRYNRAHPWWNSHLSQLKRKCLKIRRAYQETKARDPRKEKGKEFRKVLRKYRDAIGKARQNSWEKFVSSSGNEEPFGFAYKLQVDKLRLEKIQNTVRKSDGSETKSIKETAECLLEALVPDDPVIDETPEHIAIREQVLSPPETEDECAFTLEEVRRAVASLKNDKAPGPDRIEVRVLKRAWAVIGSQLLRLLNGCLEFGVFPAIWKEGSIVVLLKSADKDPTNPKSYRPICLLSVIGKLLERLLLNRLQRTALQPNMLSNRQYGFRPKLSTEDAIVDLRGRVASTKQKYALALLFDISGAFDNVWWPLVLQGLKKRNCPKNIYEVMQSYFSDRKVKIPNNQGDICKRATRGCPQGSVLGPSCWNIIFDELLVRLTELVGDDQIAFADDLLVLLRGDSRIELQNLGQAVADTVFSWCKSAKLELSKAKTEMIYLKFNPNQGKKPINGARPDRKRSSRKVDAVKSRRAPVIKIDGASIKLKSSVKYLGIHFDEQLGVQTHCLYIANKSKGLMAKLGNLAGTTWGLKGKTLGRIYQALFVPIITYAAAGWADLINMKSRQVLLSAQRHALINVTKAYRTASSDALCVVAGALPIDVHIDMRRALYSLRRNKEVRIGNYSDPNVDEDRHAKVRKEVRDEANAMWQRRWESSGKGAVTKAFFGNVRDRLSASWISTSHYVTQLLTGHGDFKVKLSSFNLVDEELCECGTAETMQHVLLDCPLYNPQRVALAEHFVAGQGEWPAVARALVTKPAFETLESFARNVLWLKSCT